MYLPLFPPLSPHTVCPRPAWERALCVIVSVCKLGVSVRRSGGGSSGEGAEGGYGGWRVLLSPRLNGSFVPQPQWGEGQGSGKHPVIMFLKIAQKWGWGGELSKGDLNCYSIASCSFGSDISFKTVQFVDNNYKRDLASVYKWAFI